MPGIAILTDSCASIPENLLKTLKIHSVAYYIHRGEEVLRDLVTVQRGEFLAWLPTAKTLPTTACPGPGDYVAAYEHIIASGQDEIISLHMTSKGSGAYQAATVARDMVLERYAGVKIEVIDTLNVSLCQGWMAIEAARAALEGYSLPDILVMVQRMIPVTRMLQTADTLKYLYMGGRIARAKHLVGSLLNIKPLISMEDGVIVPLGTTRSRQSAYEMIVAEVEKAVGTFRKIKVAYVHAGALPEAEKIKALLEARLEVAESFIAELSPALAVHTGPGTVGVCYFPVG